MRAVIQRVSKASVIVNDQTHSEINGGLLVFIGIEAADSEEDIAWLSKKIVSLRIFDDEAGVMNKSLQETCGDILLVSQFTLHAATKKGNRPSYIHAARPEVAVIIYQKFMKQLESDLGKNIKTGVFGAMMKIALLNEGPVTIWMDTKNKE
ncbi:MAG: D-tyrosyl-tRNA(Tyr) deacylase [Chitinophagales bacterium]|nr:D-tyrosyl-tRNA(Tyr) deacylase [Chitinophagales bacterium]